MARSWTTHVFQHCRSFNSELTARAIGLTCLRSLWMAISRLSVTCFTLFLKFLPKILCWIFETCLNLVAPTISTPPGLRQMLVIILICPNLGRNCKFVQLASSLAAQVVYHLHMFAAISKTLTTHSPQCRQTMMPAIVIRIKIRA